MELLGGWGFWFWRAGSRILGESHIFQRKGEDRIEGSEKTKQVRAERYQPLSGDIL